MALPFLFELWALEHQLPPDGDWKTWVIMGGRGAGKTRAGAEWVRSMVEGSRPVDNGRARRVALVGETLEQVREVMVFGESGILACSPPDRRPVWSSVRRQLEWPNGAVAQAFSAYDPERLRGPQFDAAWVDEIGCAAIDKGTNQPNKFLDPKSSESKLPRYSNGLRDEFIQTQYLKAMYDYWGSPAHNPVSTEYEGRMLDMSRAFVWAWDGRPFPRFPKNVELWSDGENYSRGHWISGRTTHRTLQSVVREMCERAGVVSYDVDNLQGMVRGYSVTDVVDMRKALQPLMLQYGFDAVDRDGVLTFTMRGAAPKAVLKESELSYHRGQSTFEKKRAADAEISGRMRLSFVEALGDFGAVTEEAVFPDDKTQAVAQAEVNVSLLRGEGRLAVERWLAEARVARDTVSFSMPMSRLDLGAGDVVEISGDHHVGELYRIDRVEQGIDLAVEATHVDPSIYEPIDFAEDGSSLYQFTAAVPVTPIFMDLPLIRGDEVEHSPHVAMSSNPWPGDIAIYSSATDEDYSLNTVVETEATVGLTETSLGQPLVGRIDQGHTVRVRLISGSLSSQSKLQLLNGGNVAAVGDGSKDNWEIIQFQTATLVAPDTYELSGLIRGQLGSEGYGNNGWPEGSRFVLLDGIPQQIDLQSGQRGLERHYRIGPANRAIDDATYVHRELAFAGNGLRPYSPVHLRSKLWANGDIDMSWIRRTRVDGDSWQGSDVPLGEEQELYHLKVLSGGVLLRDENVSTPNWTYTASMQTSDGASGLVDVTVAQVSAKYGDGTEARHVLSL